MKKQINQLVALGEQYVETAKKLGFQLDAHNHIRSKIEKKFAYFASTYNTVVENKPEVRLYFGDKWETWSLDYERGHGSPSIFVIGYKRAVELPWDIKVEELDEVVKDLEELLIPLQAMESKAAEIAENRKQAEIENLEAKLKALKNDDDTK